jgi:hypothetical protein
MMRYFVWGIPNGDIDTRKASFAKNVVPFVLSQQWACAACSFLACNK